MTPLLPIAVAFLSHTIPTTTRTAFPSQIARRMSSSSSPSSSAIMDPKYSTLPKLQTPTGEPLLPSSLHSHLSGKRVALYFSAGWCPMCTSFEPSLLAFREAVNSPASNAQNDIELIYVPSDRSEEEILKRTAAMKMLSVPLADGEADKVKARYRIWSGSECGKLGTGRRSGVPALVVLDGQNNGEEMAFLAAESKGAKALEDWDLEGGEGVW